MANAKAKKENALEMMDAFKGVLDKEKKSAPVNKAAKASNGSTKKAPETKKPAPAPKKAEAKKEVKKEVKEEAKEVVKEVETAKKPVVKETEKTVKAEKKQETSEKLKNISVYFTEEESRAVYAAARCRNMKLAAYVRSLVLEDIEKNKEVYEEAIRLEEQMAALKSKTFNFK